MFVYIFTVCVFYFSLFIMAMFRCTYLVDRIETWSFCHCTSFSSYGWSHFCLYFLHNLTPIYFKVNYSISFHS